ncbi:MAG: pantothenate kinase [Leptolyngbyaceae cyanobacterium bins.349]|nr:pantothenate kinase [Leptolyngbyaceae cyanobacterium bins.349]
MSDQWFALVIGNSRLHWAHFHGNELQDSWDEPHYGQTDGVEESLRPTPRQGKESDFPLWIASVVPEQSQVWVGHPNTRWLTLEDVPLPGMYPTLGIDRALALWGAIATLGRPVLVIDAGTALTFTGADQQRLVGGAILPGLRLQFAALGQKTAMLPALSRPNFLPPRWALTTEDAIASGILHTVTAGVQSFIQDWQQQYPGSSIVITGGDRDRLVQLLHQQAPELATAIHVDAHLIFWGIRALRSTVPLEHL